MRALIFAAGRGERLRPLTDHTPKPLLRAGGRALIEHQIAALARAGIVELVINLAHCPDALMQALGDGSRYGVRIAYSREGETAAAALETRGGIVAALALLGAAPFVAVSGDVVTDYDYARLAEPAAAVARGVADAHLVLVDNPPFHPQGDMGLANGRITRHATPRLTYANIGVYAPRLFAGLAAVRHALFPWLYAAADAGRITGEHHRGAWDNVGTAAQLAALDARLGNGTAAQAPAATLPRAS